MKFNNLVGAAAMAAVALLSGGLLAPLTATASTAPTADETYAIKIRTQMGLESDLPFIQDLESQANLNVSELGTPVTVDELSELKSRRVLGAYVNPLSNALSSMGTFAGVWFQQTGEGVIRVDLTSPVTDSITQAVNSVVPAGAAVTYTQVTYTYSQLNDLDQSILATNFSAAPTSGIVSTWIDIASNTVDVGVTTQAAVADVYAQYGSAGLNVTMTDTPISTASRNINSGPLYGGEWVAFSNGEDCTMGYGDLTNSAGQRYSITAGHCAPNGSKAYQGNASGYPPIGTGVHASQTYGKSSTQCDCEFVGPISAAQSTNKVYVTGNSLYGYSQTGSPYVGEAACHTGAASYESNKGKIVCGTVSSTTCGIEESGSPAGKFELKNCIYWSGSEIAGDSGAPLGDGGNFLGIASATSGDNKAFFSKSVLIESTTGLTLHY